MERCNTALFSPANTKGSAVCKSSPESLEKGKVYSYEFAFRTRCL